VGGGNLQEGVGLPRL